ncbi:hypothetical protein FH972_001114 [Carpinus fangiana]|uniref:Cupin type-1 domain-containing protein n=1 Tax=Carpinus fangiana TaxID=176857 RepID=A0A5N6QDE9_9ROSI|nr:hypothetical protein FH972_001114 [Carpinus fangiana]
MPQRLNIILHLECFCALWLALRSGGIVNRPHTHPHSAEHLFLVDGSLEVGFVDTTNKLFTQKLLVSDL